MAVDCKHALYEATIDRWCRCRDAFEGEDAVKAAGDKYLPRLDSHHDPIKGEELFQGYITRALFYNATRRTVGGLSGALFQKSPTMTLKQTYEDMLEDITLTGLSSEVFFSQVASDVILLGRLGVLVDMPVAEETEAMGAHPYMTSYQPEDILNWLCQRIGGKLTLIRVVLREKYDHVDPDDQYNVTQEDQIRVLELVDGKYTVTIWRKNQEEHKKEEWRIFQQHLPVRRGVPLPFIPFMFFGPASNTPDVQSPPLLDLVNVNMSHYRTMADLEHGRHYTALPTPWISTQQQPSGSLAIGSGTAWDLGPNGSAGMLEFSGAGLGSLERAETEKRKMMATLGARLLEAPSGAPETATAVGMRHSGDHATIRTIAQQLESAFTKCLQWFIWWVSTEALPEDVTVSLELNKDFFAVRLTPAELSALVAALQGETISYETFYQALVRGELARPGVTAEEELEQIRNESPAELPEEDPEEDTEDEKEEPEDEEKDPEKEEDPEQQDEGE